MAAPPAQNSVLADIDADFLRGSYLVYAVPLATESRLEDELELCARKGQSLPTLVKEIEERESLFFGTALVISFSQVPASRLVPH